MRIKKVSKTTPTQSQIVNSYSESTNDAYSCNYINSVDQYSTNEVKTNKTWIDGKPIYRKVIELTNVPVGYKDHLHNISNLGDIINVYGRFKESTVQNPVCRVVADNITTYGLGIVDINTTQFHTLLGSGVAPTNTMKVVFEYTKTTD